MKTIIAGSRDFLDYHHLTKVMSEISWIPTEIVSGTARGTDRLGEKWAYENNIKLVKFPADWNTYGKRAGYIRNDQMACYADAAVIFWLNESKGTKHMIDLAKKRNLLLKLIYAL